MPNNFSIYICVCRNCVLFIFALSDSHDFNGCTPSTLESCKTHSSSTSTTIESNYWIQQVYVHSEVSNAKLPGAPHWESWHAKTKQGVSSSVGWWNILSWWYYLFGGEWHILGPRHLWDHHHHHQTFIISKCRNGFWKGQAKCRKYRLFQDVLRCFKLPKIIPKPNYSGVSWGAGSWFSNSNMHNRIPTPLKNYSLKIIPKEIIP